MKQLSDNLDKSKMSIYNHLHTLFIKNDGLIRHTYINKDGKRVFDNVLINELSKSFNRKPRHKLSKTKNHGKLYGLMLENKALKSNLNDKRNEIKTLNRLLNQQQQLQLSSQSEIKHLKGRVNHGWIYRLFHQ